MPLILTDVSVLRWRISGPVGVTAKLSTQSFTLSAQSWWTWLSSRNAPTGTTSRRRFRWPRITLASRDFSTLKVSVAENHDDIMTWKHFPHYWPFVWGIHQSCWSHSLGKWAVIHEVYIYLALGHCDLIYFAVALHMSVSQFLLLLPFRCRCWQTRWEIYHDVRRPVCQSVPWSRIQKEL